LIRVYVGSDNECFRAFTELLYKQRIERDMRKAILEVRKNKETINLNEDDK